MAKESIPPILGDHLGDHYIGAGTDAASGLPVLHLDDVSALGFNAPDQRYLVAPETARKVGAALLLAADPGVAWSALAALARHERGAVPEEQAEGGPISVGYAVDPTKVIREGDQTIIPEAALKVVSSSVFVLTDAGKVVAESANHGATWAETAKRLQQYPVVEGLGEFEVRPGAVSQEALRFTSVVRDVPPEAYATPREFAASQHGVRSGEAAVLTQRGAEAMGAMVVGERYTVDVPRAIVAYVVESPELVTVHLNAERPDGKLNNVVRVEPGRRLVVVSREASTEGLRTLAEAVAAELRRRGEGE